MSPNEVRDAIGDEYKYLKYLAEKKQLNPSAISNIIRGKCEDGARHCGMGWRWFLPTELEKEF